TPPATRRSVDVLIAFALIVFAYLLGVGYVRRAVSGGLKPEFYQREFGPAVMMACGRGYVSPVPGDAAALDQFLALERDTLECRDIPAGVRLQARLSLSQYVWKYLLWTAAAIWRVRGLAWAALVPLSGAMFAATVGLSYALARLLAGR